MIATCTLPVCPSLCNPSILQLPPNRRLSTIATDKTATHINTIYTSAMDETTFQHQLRELKQRVSDMADTSTSLMPIPRPHTHSGLAPGVDPNYHQDLYTAQLSDVKHKLDRMQATLPIQWQGQAAETETSSTAILKGQASLRQDIRAINETVEDASSQLHEISDWLKTEIWGRFGEMHCRFDVLEKAIAELGSNAAFTPASSEANVEDLTASLEGFPANATDVPQMGTCKDSNRNGEDALFHGRPAGFESVAQLIQETCPRPAVLSEPFLAVCPSKNYQPANFDTSTNLAELKVEQATNQRLRDVIAARDEEIAELEVGQIADRREKDAAISHLNDCRSAAEQAFEITRSDLEKRLGEAEGRLAESETEIRRWRKSAESAQRDLKKMAKTNFELQDARDIERSQFRYDLKQCEESRHHFMTKYVDENYRLRWLEQARFQSEQRLHQQLEEYQIALEDSERNRNADISDALRSRDEDLDKMHVFCGEKDAVVYRQEKVIEQGAAILQERDAEIDRLTAALDESRLCEQDAREHAAKNKRTIQKRDGQLEALHCEVREERGRRCRLEDLMRRDADAMRHKAKDVRFSADERDSGMSFTNAADVPAYAISRGQSGRQKPLWTPQPIRSTPRLPHEVDRASLWEDGVHATTKHKFGASSPIVQQKRQSGRGGSKDECAPRGHDDHKRSFSSGNGAEEGSRGQHSAMYPDPSRHQSEPLVSNREALQLLAGWTETLQGQQQRDSRQHEQQTVHPTRQTQADMSQQSGGGGGSGGRERRSQSSRMKAQGQTNGRTAENGRHALPLDTTWLPAPAESPVVVERVGSLPDLRAGSRSSESRNHASSRGHGAMSKPASMFDLRPQKRHTASPRQTYRAPSAETEAESSSADEREREKLTNLVDYS